MWVYFFSICIFDSARDTAKVERQEEREIAAIFNTELSATGRPKRAAATVSLAKQDREEHKEAAKQLAALRKAAAASAAASSSSSKRSYADRDQDSHDEHSDAEHSNSSGSISSSSSSASSSGGVHATAAKKAAPSLRQPTLSRDSFSAHTGTTGSAKASALPSSFRAAASAADSAAGSAGNSCGCSSSSSSSGCSRCSSNNRSSSSSSSSSSSFDDAADSLELDGCGDDDAGLVDHFPEYSDEAVRFRELAKIKEMELKQARLDIDQEVENAIGDQKKKISSDRHDEKIFKPWIEALLFNLGDRFPDSAIMCALQNVFDPAMWTLDDDVFMSDNYLLADLKVLAAHFSQCTTLEDKQPAIVTNELLLELRLGKTWLWECWTGILRRRKDVASASAAGNGSSAKKSDQYFNPILKAANAVLENISPLVAPCVESNMFELIVQFLEVETIKESAPNFMLLAKIAITITVSTASCERGFSLMKLILTRLRTRMSQVMLDALMRINLLGGALLNRTEIREIVLEWHAAKDRKC